jgi:hypothetical protein
MDCAEFQRRCTVDPRGPGAALRRHAAHCPDCAAHRERQRELDRWLREAFAVEVPSGLSERLLRPQRPVMRCLGWPSARSVGLALALLGAVALGSLHAGHGLAWRVSVNAAQMERMPMPPHTVPRRELQGMLAALGAELVGEIGAVAYCDLRSLDGHPAGRMLIAGRRGRVVVVLMPGRPVTQRTPVGDGGLHGVVVPAARGSMGILGVDGEPLGPIEVQLREALRWP